MKKWFFLLLSLPVFLGACNKAGVNNKCSYEDLNVIAPTAEITYLQDYLNTNSIPAIQHSSGLFYAIEDPGTGATASVCSNVTVNYSGSLIPGGTVFDFNSAPSGVSFTLGQLIPGWQKGLPLIKSGGQMTLYIPPTLGYGALPRTDGNGTVIIPANSYLKFTVHLLDVQ